jgi:NADPH-dependent 2,4-dienoyl-CoA reductase/sulfur reductase-like enzyme/Pyruvate/2-oxoacid:ferredoxin oxidoreductase delta subunit
MSGDRRIVEHPILPQPTEPTVPFTFNGQGFLARENEVISSALYAHGVDVFNLHHKDSAPQGIFCANGQCAQCLVLVDGSPAKGCITPVRAGMEVRSLEGLPELPEDDEPVPPSHIHEQVVEVLVIGAGPAGLSAAVELGHAGVSVLIVDDKQELGGKLSLQTHNFFGSIRDCNAGMRGMDIGTLLASEIEDMDNVGVWLESPVVGVFSDGRIGIVRKGIYNLIRPKHVLFATGAREKSLAFPGCDLPGVYGAGAFQTIVNRDMVRSSARLFIVGGGNVGLIAAYHALQAGIEVLGIVEALPRCGGYKVHEDKIKRFGVPVLTSHTVTRAEGDGRVEKVTIAEADEDFNPIAGTERTFECDTLLIAVGLDPVNELTAKAEEFGYSVYEAGDAAEIAEASAAMFSGRITGRSMLRGQGYDVHIPKEWHDLLETLRAKPGPVHEQTFDRPDTDVYPVIRCNQEIPCNPCTAVCPKNSINTVDGTLSSIPVFGDECVGCTRCVVICPGLAITLVDRGYDPSGEKALVTVPWEMPHGLVRPSHVIDTVGFEGESIGRGKIVAVRDIPWQNRRQLLLLEVPSDEADLVAGIRLCGPPEEMVGEAATDKESRDTIICRCERVTRGEIIDYIRETGCTDFNALKAALRPGMGPCGGRTCRELVMRIFRQELGRDAEVEAHVERPLFQEVPLKIFLEVDK